MKDQDGRQTRTADDNYLLDTIEYMVVILLSDQLRGDALAITQLSILRLESDIICTHTYCFVILSSRLE